MNTAPLALVVLPLVLPRAAEPEAPTAASALGATVVAVEAFVEVTPDHGWSLHSVDTEYVPRTEREGRAEAPAFFRVRLDVTSRAATGADANVQFSTWADRLVRAVERSEAEPLSYDRCRAALIETAWRVPLAPGAAADEPHGTHRGSISVDVPLEVAVRVASVRPVKVAGAGRPLDLTAVAAFLRRTGQHVDVMIGNLTIGALRGKDGPNGWTVRQRHGKAEEGRSRVSVTNFLYQVERSTSALTCEAVRLEPLDGDERFKFEITLSARP